MTYSGGIAGNFVPHGGSGGSAIPGNDISDGGPGLIPEEVQGADVPEDQQHLYESGLGENPTKPKMNYGTSPNGGLHHQSYVDHDWSRQDKLDILAKLDSLNHKLDHVLEHFHANTTWTANLGDGASVTFRKDSAG